MEKPPIDPWLLKYNNILLENDNVYRKAARKLNVSESTLWILYSLRAEAKPMTQSHMCQLLHQPKQTVNSALKQLEAQGYISLRAGDDRRTKEIVLTKKGNRWRKKLPTWLSPPKSKLLQICPPKKRPLCLPCSKSIPSFSARPRKSCCKQPDAFIVPHRFRRFLCEKKFNFPTISLIPNCCALPFPPL